MIMSRLLRTTALTAALTAALGVTAASAAYGFAPRWSGAKSHNRGAHRSSPRGGMHGDIVWVQVRRDRPAGQGSRTAKCEHASVVSARAKNCASGNARIHGRTIVATAVNTVWRPGEDWKICEVDVTYACP